MWVHRRLTTLRAYGPPRPVTAMALLFTFLLYQTLMVYGGVEAEFRNSLHRHMMEDSNQI
jgi:hypothetical protein